MHLMNPAADPAPSPSDPFPYEGDPALRIPITEALRGIVDPEMSLDILSLGLVYGVRIAPDALRVRLTMTSAACPVAEMLADDVAEAIERVVGDGRPVDVELVWDPPWSPQRMSDSARRAMGW